MKPNNLAYAVALAIGSASLPAGALELYVDSKTKQIYAEPGKGRVKLGAFERVDDESGEVAKPSAGKPGKGKSTETDSIKAVKAAELRLNNRIDAIANKPKDPSDSKVKMDKDGVRFESNDGAFKFSLNGRLHTDATLNSGGDITTWRDANNNNRVDRGEIPSITTQRLTDGTEIRRFRMEFAAKFYDDWNMKMQPEFSNSGGNGTIGIRDAYIQYTGFDWGAWTVGQSKQPFSLQQMMSSNDMVFMERSLEYVTTNSSVNRAIGLRFDTGGKNWGAATGIFGDTATRQTGGTTAADDEGWGASGRATWAPLYKPGELIHVGTSVAYRSPRPGDHTVTYTVAPAAVDHVSYLSTGPMLGVNNSQFFNAEAAAVWGPFSLEGEYNAAWINRSGTGISDAFISGYHADLVYSLTGESRTSSYDAKQGVFKRLTPNRNFDFAGGWGAWELKSRIQYVDMNDLGQQYQRGGRALAATFGFNWYWNTWARFMVDWTHVFDLDPGTAQVSLKALPDSSTSGWDQVSARVSLAY